MRGGLGRGRPFLHMFKIQYSRDKMDPFVKEGCDFRWTRYPGEFNLYVWIGRTQHFWRLTWPKHGPTATKRSG